MKLERMREFLVLAKELNYSIAAGKLFVSQSVLSRHINDLEREIGVPLLERSTHYVELTQMGIEACSVFKEIVEKYDAFLELSANVGKSMAGQLKLGLLYYSMDDYFSDFLPMFQEKYPLIQLECNTYQPHEMYRDLLNGKIDVGQMAKGNYPGSEQVIFHPFAKTKMVAALHKDHPLAAKDGVWLKELEQEILILLKDDICSRTCVLEMVERCGVDFVNQIETAHIETVPGTIRKIGGVHLTGENCRKQNGRDIRYVAILDKKSAGDEAFLYRKMNSNPLIPLFLAEVDKWVIK